MPAIASFPSLLPVVLSSMGLLRCGLLALVAVYLYSSSVSFARWRSQPRQHRIVGPDGRTLEEIEATYRGDKRQDTALRWDRQFDATWNGQPVDESLTESSRAEGFEFVDEEGEAIQYEDNWVNGDDVEIRTLRHGDRLSFPNKGTWCRIFYNATLQETGEVFDLNPHRWGHEIRIGHRGHIRGWDEGLMMMSLGEIARLRIPASKGYGVLGSYPEVPANADLIYQIHLVEMSRQSMRAARGSKSRKVDWHNSRGEVWRR